MNLKIALICLISFFISFAVPLFAQEQITITTYYPSPYGSYRNLSWGRFPNTRGLLAADSNAGSAIELGGLNSSSGAGTPYIDFSNDMSSDYDYRIVLNDDNELQIRGGTYNTANPDSQNNAEVIISDGSGIPARVRVREVWFCRS